MFRVGRADETFTALGLSHLVEHLALFDLGRQPYSFNGSSAATITRFYASGTPEEVASFIEGVGRGLTSLQPGRLDTEKRVLAAEAAGSEADIYSRLLAMRFGQKGWGLGTSYEWALDWVEAEAVERWAAQHFHTANACMWFTGPPPPGLDPGLPRGEPVPMPALEEDPELEFPAYVEQGTGGVALSALVPRARAITTGFSVVRNRAHEKLRLEHGHSYSAGFAYQPLNAELAHATLVADCQDPSAATVRDLLLDVLDDVAENGPEADEIAWQADQQRRGDEDPGTLAGFLDTTAEDTLIGAPCKGAPEHLAEAQALTADEVAAAVSAARDSMILCVPSDIVAERPERFRPLPELSRESLGGTAHRATSTWRRWGEHSELLVADDGLTLRLSDGTSNSIRFEDCVGVITGLGGTLQLVHEFGTSLTVRPGCYDDPGGIRKAVRAGVPKGTWIPFDERQQRVQPVVDLELGPALVDLLPLEVDALPAVLADDELPEHLAMATKGNRSGLLVVTPARVMFIFRGRESEFWEADRPKVSSASTKGLMTKRLLIQADGSKTEFTEVAPESRLAEIVASLGA